MGCYECKYNQVIDNGETGIMAYFYDVCMLYRSEIRHENQYLDEAIDCKHCNAELTDEEMDSILEDFNEKNRSKVENEPEEYPF